MRSPDLYLGDCLFWLAMLPDNSIDSIVTDPPYGLSFMGKKWDYDVPGEAIWRECLRVLKPGGHLLAFAGTRTQHRMAVRIEDAGFEIRDMIAWVYGSGFPKSLDVSKAIDKRGGTSAEFASFRDDVKEAMQRNSVTRSALQGALGNFMLSHYLTAGSQPAVPNLRDYQIIRDTVGLGDKWDAAFNAEAEREVVGSKNSGLDKGSGASVDFQGSKGRNIDGLIDITAPATEAARQWQGWGTALKPALEPVTVARKPLVGTVAENVLAHGTGALNIDGCRVPSEEAIPVMKSTGGRKFEQTHTQPDRRNQQVGVQTQGRWPANLIHDGSDEVVAGFPESNGSGSARKLKRGQRADDDGWGMADQSGELRDAGTGSAARFFYCAKASKKDRDDGCEGLDERPSQKMGDGLKSMVGHPSGNNGNTSTQDRKSRNHHPTVKPTDLMRYLCRLVTPPGGTVLDPFMGSGSTGKAAALEGFHFIGMERDADYFTIAQARIDHARKAD